MRSQYFKDQKWNFERSSTYQVQDPPGKHQHVSESKDPILIELFFVTFMFLIHVFWYVQSDGEWMTLIQTCLVSNI